MAQEVNLTYEVIFELVMREKSREELQKLPADFADSAIAYFARTREQAQTLPEEAGDALERQASNALRLVKELYERREKKLVNIALTKVRAENAIVDFAAMLDEERSFFEALIALMRSHRQTILSSRLEAARPSRRTEAPVAQSAPAEQAQESVVIATKLIRFLNPVPKFVGRELEVYGPFEEEEMANLPAEIADVLIAKGRAEEVSG